MEFLIIFVARMLLGVMLSFLLMGSAHVAGIVLLVSPTPTTVQLTSLLTTSIGAAIGGYVSWLTFDSSLRFKVLVAILALGLAMAGSWTGMLQGRTLYIPGGQPGIPQLRGAFVGALVGGSLAPMGAYLLAASFQRGSTKRSL